MRQESVKIYFDGGSRGNPGPASGAAYADYDGGREKACFLASATNNEAEYRGLLMGIELARELNLDSVMFLGDSKLVVMQVSGQWQAKHPQMQILKQEVLTALAKVPRWTIAWIRREANGEADRVANETMDRHQGIIKSLCMPKEPQSLPLLPADASGPKPVLRADVQKLNGLGAKASFADFRSLKVGGMDSFSRASLTALMSLIPEFSQVQESFVTRLRSDRQTQSLGDAEKDKLLLNALRWAARGLAGELPLRKVLVDLEVTQNIRGKKK